MSDERAPGYNTLFRKSGLWMPAKLPTTLHINRFLLQLYPSQFAVIVCYAVYDFWAYSSLKRLVSSVNMLPGGRKQKLTTMRWLSGGAQLYSSCDLDSYIDLLQQLRAPGQSHTSRITTGYMSARREKASSDNEVEDGTRQWPTHCSLAKLNSPYNRSLRPAAGVEV